MPSRFRPFAGAGVPQVGEESRPVITCGSLTGFRSGAPQRLWMQCQFTSLGRKCVQLRGYWGPIGFPGALPQLAY